MSPAERRRRLDALLPLFHDLWHAQPFRVARPDWCARWPALTGRLLGLDDPATTALNDDAPAALAQLAGDLPEIGELAGLLAVPARAAPPPSPESERWAWEIPGRKRAQIEAFAAAAAPAGQPVLDWCGGKGHLGRLLAWRWQQPVTTLEIDPQLCADGRALAARLAVDQRFVEADALAAELPAAGHAVALHACGELHRRLVGEGAAAGLARLDVAPCCYHRGVGESYRPLAAGASTRLSRDDVRLAVTETVTASPRLARQRDREMAWKLAFVEWQRRVSGDYRSFKPVPAAWWRYDGAAFLAAMAARSGLPAPGAAEAAACLDEGWRRQREVMRLSIVRHAFRRALEIWLALDLVVCLQAQGYAVELATFCPRALTPRNLLISARR